MIDYIALYFFLVLVGFAIAYAITKSRLPLSRANAFNHAASLIFGTLLAQVIMNFLSRGMNFFCWIDVHALIAPIVGGASFILLNEWYLRREKME